MGIDVAEIRLQDGFTSKELDPTISLYYGVYPALCGSARYYPDRRLFGRDPSDDSWRVEDRALRARQWLSVDPMARKYPGWSPYDYVRDNPATSIDPNGASEKPRQYYKENINLKLPPLTLANQSEGNPARIASNGFSTPRNSSFGKSLVKFVQKTSAAATSVYFWAGLASGALAVGTAAIGQEEFAVPLFEVSGSSFDLAGYAAQTDFAATLAEASTHMISWRRGDIQMASIAAGFGLGHMADLPYVDVPAVTTGTRIAGEYLGHEAEGVVSTLGGEIFPKPAQ